MQCLLRLLLLVGVRGHPVGGWRLLHVAMRASSSARSRRSAGRQLLLWLLPIRRRWGTGLLLRLLLVRPWQRHQRGRVAERCCCCRVCCWLWRVGRRGARRHVKLCGRCWRRLRRARLLLLLGVVVRGRRRWRWRSGRGCSSRRRRAVACWRPRDLLPRQHRAWVCSKVLASHVSDEVLRQPLGLAHSLCVCMCLRLRACA
jgi:hypothetical protein